MLHVEAQFSGPTGYSLKPGIWRSSRAEAPAGGMTARGIHTLDAMIQIARETETTPHLIHEAPVTTPVRRLDQTLAARQPVLRWRPSK